MAGYVLSDLLARYRRAFPGVTVSAIEDNGDYLEHLLIGGELDVAVIVISNLRNRMALQTEILEVSPYRLWLPLGHRLASAESITVAEVAEEPVIMLTIDEIEESTAKLLSAIGSRPKIAFPDPVGGSGAQSRRHRRRRGAVAGSGLPALVAGKATGSRAAMCRGACRWSRSALPGGGAANSRRPRAISSACRRRSARSASAKPFSEPATCHVT